MLSSCNCDEDVPQHRIVFADGGIGSAAHRREQETKSSKLKLEGVKINGGRVVDLEEIRYREFLTGKPLEKIRDEQIMFQKYIEESGGDMEAPIAAFDVSYFGRTSYGVMVTDHGSRLEIDTQIGRTKFPYISGYLAYREFPAIRDLLGQNRRLLLIDGNGTLHPRRMGLATFSGILLNATSIGIAKSRTNIASGNIELSIGGRAEGVVLSKNVIISPGNRISLNNAVSFYMKRLGPGYPRLLKIAHNETVKLRKSSFRQ